MRIQERYLSLTLVQLLSSLSLYILKCSLLSLQRCHAGIMIIFLIILLSIRTVSGNSLLRGNCVSSIKGSVLVKHCYTSLMTHNILECYYQCKEDKLCQSLNFYEKKNLCELNNRTRAVGSPNFLSYADSIYLDNSFRGTFWIHPFCSELLFLIVW